jgi:hypothetical protein
VSFFPMAIIEKIIRRRSAKVCYDDSHLQMLWEKYSDIVNAENDKTEATNGTGEAAPGNILPGRTKETG